MSTIAAASIGIEVIDPIDWSDDTPLRTGVDYHAGTTYITVPARFHQNKQVRKGKKTEIVLETLPALIVITSDRRSFAYKAEELAKLNPPFTPIPNVVIPLTRRWTPSSIKDFLRGHDDAPNPTDLYNGLRNIYETYIEFAREEFYDILPLFVLGSYMFRLFKSLGYIHFNGTAASGKSQNLRLLDALALNAEWAANISAAALYRTLAGFPGVILVDEAESFDSERGQDLRAILNAGYLDGSTVKRAEKGPNDQFQVVSFQTFGPKAIASINPLDAVIASRCLIILMRPALRTIAEFDKDDPRWQRLRDRLYLWAMYHTAPVAALTKQWNTTTRHDRAPGLISRQWQTTQLYVILADYIDSFDAGDRCNRLIAFFNTYFSEIQKQQDATDRIRLVLQALPRLLALHAPIQDHWYFLKTIHDVVSDYLEIDARDYYKTRNLAKHLDVLGFRTKRSSRQGTQLWITPDQIRTEFHQRRVSPQPEDSAWLAGEVEYIHNLPPPPTQPPDEPLSVWDTLTDEDPTP